MRQFSTSTFAKLTQDFLSEDELHTVVLDINECLSDFDSFHESGIGNNQHRRHFVHPEDPSRILEIYGSLLPQNGSISVFTAALNKDTTTEYEFCS
jgi:hypothetical protein